MIRGVKVEWTPPCHYGFNSANMTQGSTQVGQGQFEQNVKLSSDAGSDEPPYVGLEPTLHVDQ